MNTDYRALQIQKHLIVNPQTCFTLSQMGVLSETSRLMASCIADYENEQGILHDGLQVASLALRVAETYCTLDEPLLAAVFRDYQARTTPDLGAPYEEGDSEPEHMPDEVKDLKRVEHIEWLISYDAYPSRNALLEISPGNMDVVLSIMARSIVRCEESKDIKFNDSQLVSLAVYVAHALSMFKDDRFSGIFYRYRRRSISLSRGEPL
ncbi:MAG: hypothetical protein CMQ34_08805 [Gammaproteobacteria bacterium]|nr:hypothetical protein [Gammaproteobacteria bacterium]|tara:strand:- start:2276 stop:2899 length:624 start_codon:yes stop_codon:yes gene_type:complete